MPTFGPLYLSVLCSASMKLYTVDRDPTIVGSTYVQSLNTSFDRDVRPWLDLVDELRAHGISQDLPLPQIAVMGDQSCGKSSVLEV